jgi:mannitol-specific phosphotransferase system IIBC component
VFFVSPSFPSVLGSVTTVVVILVAVVEGVVKTGCGRWLNQGLVELGVEKKKKEEKKEEKEEEEKKKEEEEKEEEEEEEEEEKKKEEKSLAEVVDFDKGLNSRSVGEFDLREKVVNEKKKKEKKDERRRRKKKKDERRRRRKEEVLE